MQNKETEKKVFGSLAECDNYSEGPLEEYYQLYQYFFQGYNSQAGQTILDLGCGTGNNSIRLAKLGFRVTGIDISSKAIQVAKRKVQEEEFEVTFMVGDAETMTFGSSTFDICFCGAILHHFQDIDRVANELFRITKKGGMVCSFDPNASHPYSNFTHNILNKWFYLHKFYKYFSENERALTSSDLQSAFERAGFKEFEFTSMTLHSKKKNFRLIRNLIYSLCSMSHSTMKSGNMILMKCKKNVSQ